MTQQHLILIRLENLFIALAGLFFYHYLGFNWSIFLYLILVPDIMILGYLINNKLGALCYNLSHNYIIPLILLSVSLYYSNLQQIALILIIHIGTDRALGFGLKNPETFNKTHLSHS